MFSIESKSESWFVCTDDKQTMRQTLAFLMTANQLWAILDFNKEVTLQHGFLFDVWRITQQQDNLRKTDLSAEIVIQSRHEIGLHDMAFVSHL